MFASLSSDSLVDLQLRTQPVPDLPGGQPSVPDLPGGQPSVPDLPGGQPSVPDLPGAQPSVPDLPGGPAFCPRHRFLSARICGCLAISCFHPACRLRGHQRGLV